ncbi:MAG: hypothetical protein QXG18_00505 [Candidatus Pacearchaeota archaeon]
MIIKEAEPIFINKSQEKVVLLIHGLGGTPLELKELAEYLGEANLSVVVPLLSYQERNYSEIKKLDSAFLYLEIEKIYLNLKKDYKKVFVVGLCNGRF